MPDQGEIHCNPQTREEKFIASLEKAIAFHRTNPNDPYGIGNGVICSLIEVRESFAEAYGLPKVKRP